MLPMLREKHIFLLPMLRKNASFDFLHPSAEIMQKKKTFSLRRGCKNRKCASHAPWEAQLFTLLMEHEKHNFDFCNLSRLTSTFLTRHARFRPVLAGSGRFSIRTWDLGVQLGPHYSRRGWWLHELIKQTPSNYMHQNLWAKLVCDNEIWKNGQTISICNILNETVWTSSTVDLLDRLGVIQGALGRS